jgi:hypothetical protein
MIHTLPCFNRTNERSKTMINDPHFPVLCAIGTRNLPASNQSTEPQNPKTQKTLKQY